MKKLLHVCIISCFFGFNWAACATGAVETEDEGWTKLSSLPLAAAISVATQDSDRRSPYGCGPNQVARICSAAGCAYPYPDALDKFALEGDLAVCGNNVGLSIEEWDQLDDSEKEKLRSSSHDKLRKAGAHYVVDSFCDIIPCLDDIERRLAAREQI